MPFGVPEAGWGGQVYRGYGGPTQMSGGAAAAGGIAQGLAAFMQAFQDAKQRKKEEAKQKFYESVELMDKGWPGFDPTKLQKLARVAGIPIDADSGWKMEDIQKYQQEKQNYLQAMAQSQQQTAPGMQFQGAPMPQGGGPMALPGRPQTAFMPPPGAGSPPPQMPPPQPLNQKQGFLSRLAGGLPAQPEGSVSVGQQKIMDWYAQRQFDAEMQRKLLQAGYEEKLGQVGQSKAIRNDVMTFLSDSASDQEKAAALGRLKVFGLTKESDFPETILEAMARKRHGQDAPRSVIEADVLKRKNPGLGEKYTLAAVELAGQGMIDMDQVPDLASAWLVGTKPKVKIKAKPVDMSKVLDASLDLVKTYPYITPEKSFEVVLLNLAGHPDAAAALLRSEKTIGQLERSDKDRAAGFESERLQQGAQNIAISAARLKIDENAQSIAKNRFVFDVIQEKLARGDKLMARAFNTIRDPKAKAEEKNAAVRTFVAQMGTQQKLKVGDTEIDFGDPKVTIGMLNDPWWGPPDLYLEYDDAPPKKMPVGQWGIPAGKTQPERRNPGLR